MNAPVQVAKPGQRADAFDPALHPNAPGAARALGSEPAPSGRRQCRGHPAGRRAGRPRSRRAARSHHAVPVIRTRRRARPLPRSRRSPRRRSPRSRRLARGLRAAAIAAAAHAPPAAAGNVQLATLPPSASPKDEYELAYGYVLHKDYALAEQAFRDFLRKYPNEKLVAGRAILAGREPVPAAALSRRGGILPRGVDQIRASPPRRRIRCCVSASRSPRSARRKPPAPRSPKSAANIRAPRPA